MMIQGDCLFVLLDVINYSSKTKNHTNYSLRFKTKGTFGEISLKLRQTVNWNVAGNNVNVVDDELPSQSTNNLHLFSN
jgi:hypothetical protein